MEADDHSEPPAARRATSARFTLLDALYWLMPFLLFAVQLRFSVAQMTQLRYEEQVESIRGPFWLDMHGVLDGLSTNVGYYALVMLVYRCFGFSLFLAKYVRAGLQLLSLLCLAETLRRTMGIKRGFVPLLAFGLSPTLLYLNALQTGFGIDLQFFPICLLILAVHRFRADLASWALSFLLGAIAMFACLCYPTFILYLPALAAAAVWMFFRMRRQSPVRFEGAVVHLLCMGLGFAAPFAATLLWVDRPGILLYDPASHAGIFRAGGGGSLSMTPAAFLSIIRVELRDLLVRGESYNFDLEHAEFSGLPGLAALLFVLAFSALGFARDRRLRPAVAICWALIAISLLVPVIGRGEPGLRRSTGMLAGFYVLYAIAWQRLTRLDWKTSKRAWIGIACCLLLPLHSLAWLPANQKAMADPSFYSDKLWFYINGSPRQTLDYFLDQTKKGIPIVMLDKSNEVALPAYIRIYPAVAGWRRWNHQPEIPIYGFDPRLQQPIRMEPAVWESNYWPHY